MILRFILRDIFADANILQGAIFHEDCTEDAEEDEIFKMDQGSLGNSKRENLAPLQSKAKSNGKAKPAAHRVGVFFNFNKVHRM